MYALGVSVIVNTPIRVLVIVVGEVPLYQLLQIWFFIQD